MATSIAVVVPMVIAVRRTTSRIKTSTAERAAKVAMESVIRSLCLQILVGRRELHRMEILVARLSTCSVRLDFVAVVATIVGLELISVDLRIGASRVGENVLERDGKAWSVQG